MKEIFTIFLMYITCFFFGNPLKVILLRKKLAGESWIITPWLGISTIILLNVYLGRMGISVNDAKYFVLVCFVLINGLLWIKFKQKHDIGKDCIRYLIFSLIITTIILLPKWISKGSPDVFLTGNSDFISYSFSVKAMCDETLQSLTPSIPSFPQIFNNISGPQTRLICILFSFFACILNINPITITYIGTLFIYIMGILLLIPLLKEKVANKILYLAIFFVAFNPIYLWLFWYGFIGQISSLGYTLLIIIIYLEILKEYTWKNVIVFALFLVSLIQVYPEGTPYIALVIIAYSLLQIRKKDRFINLLKTGIFTLLFIALLDYKCYVNLFKTIISVSGVSAGWEMPIAFLLHRLGFLNDYYGAINIKIIPDVIVIVLSFILICIMIRCLWKKRKENNIYMFVLVGMIVLLSVYGIFINIYPKYQIFKSNIAIAFICIIAFIIFADSWIISAKINNKIRYMGAVSVAICSLLSIGNIYYFIMVNAKENNFDYINKDYYQLEQVIENQGEDKFFLNVSDWWQEMFAEYIFLDEDVEVMSGAGYSRANQFPKGVFPEVGDVDVTASIYPDPVWTKGNLILENSIYTAKKMDVNSIYCYEKYGLESQIKLNQYRDKYFIDTIRMLNSNQAECYLWSSNEQKETIYLDVLNDDNINKSIIVELNDEVIYDGKLKEKSVNKIIINNVTFNGDENNKLEIQLDSFEYTGICNLSFGIKEESANIKAVQIISGNVILSDIKNKYFGKELKSVDMRSKIIINEDEVIMNKNETKTIDIKVKNEAEAIIGLNLQDIRMGIHLLDENKEVLIGDYGRITDIRGSFYWGNNDMISMEYTIDTERLHEGIYYLQFQMLQENVAWYPPEYEGNIKTVKLEVVN